MTVQGWFAVVFAGFAVLVIAAAVVIGQLLAQGRVVSADLDGGILPAQAQAYRLQGALVDQETGVRGYGITGQAAFLQPYTAGLATQASATTRLRRLIGADPLLAADLRGLEAAASQWRRSYAAPLIALARHGPLGGRDLGLLDASKHSFDHLRTLFARQNAHLAAAASHDSARLGRDRTINNWAFSTVLAVFLIASAVLALVLHNAVAAPLNRLRAASRSVLGGDFGHRIEPSGPADLRAVAADVEAMRSELVTALGSARAAEQVAASQAADLDAKAAELLRSNAELEQFAYVASHDLQEPLRKVAAFCQLLEKRYGDKLDDRGRQYIDFAVDGAKRLQVLINDLLTISRVGRASEIRIRVRLDEALDRAIAALGAAIEETGAVIERPPRLPEVLGDQTLLVMLWQNLLGNAIKFRTPGCPPVMRITAERDLAGRWLCCIADQGIGIAPEFAEKVFVIFQRLHGRDSYPGTGIGLALCRRIAEYHGGDISIDTGYAEGTRVCFTLPAADDAVPGPPAPDHPAPDRAAPDQAAPDQAVADRAAGQVSASSPEGILT